MSLRKRVLQSTIAAIIVVTCSLAQAGWVLDPNGFTSLGTITNGTGALTFDTTTGSLSGGLSGTGQTVYTGSGQAVSVFTFSSIDLQTAPTLTGDLPIAILSQGDFTLNTTLSANGGGGGHRQQGYGVLGGFDGGDARRDGSASSNVDGKGPGGSPGASGSSNDASGGAGHGGGGGAANYPAGSTYGTETLDDLIAGSGAGGSYNKGGGAGGGAIELGAVGNLLVDTAGLISANGGSGAGSGSQITSGGGSGGAILLAGNDVTIDGTVRAKGGNGGDASGGQLNGGGGGGGRIAVYSNAAASVGGTVTADAGVAVGTNSVGQDGSDGTVHYGMPRNTVGARIVTLDGTSGSNSISTAYDTTGNLEVNLGFFADYLIVGGGGGGGVRKASSRGAGGGGAGGLIYAEGVDITSGASVTVGAGGAGGVDLETPVSGDLGDNGGDSILTLNGITLTALGGGGGGKSYSSGKDGGSGGGAGGGRGGDEGDATQTQPPPGYGTGYGNDGGDRTGNSQYTPGAGGGGAGAAGSNSDGGGNGGAGLDFDITGTSVGYAGGGGGTDTQGNNGGSASHGGGAGSTSGARDGQDGVDGTGGGGGASADPNGDGTGGNGGSGIVVVRYVGPALATGGDSITENVDGTDTVHQFTTVGSSTLDLSGLDLDARLGATLTGEITGPGSLIYNGPGTLTLAADNTYAGDTIVNAGTLNMNGSLLMDINDGGSNQLLGDGALNLDGVLNLDLAGVTGFGNWLLVDVDNLTEAYGTGFSVAMNGGPVFTEASDVWTYSDAGGDWTFTEGTGYLDFAATATAVIPEPSTLAIWSLGLLGLVWFTRRRKR